jgi:hypothetical protein
MFPIGCCISFCGIFIISKAVPPEKEIFDGDDIDGSEGSSSVKSPTLAQTPVSRMSSAMSGGTVSGSARERYRSRMSTCVGGPMLGFLAQGSIVDRDGISDTIKRRRRSSVLAARDRRQSKSMGAVNRGAGAENSPIVSRSSTMPPPSSV